MKFGRKALSAVLLFVALVLANYIAANLPLRLDATANHIYTLSKGTKSILSKIEDPVTLDFYFTRNARGLPTMYQDYAARVEAMLRLYSRAANGRIVLNVINPEPDSNAEEAATTAGLQEQTMPSGDKFILGLVATQADQQKVIKAFDPRRESFLEYDLSQLIFDVQQIDKKKLGLISSLPLKAKLDYMAMQNGQIPQNQYVLTAWEKHFDVDSIAPTADSLPKDLDVLAIVQPRNLSPKLQYAIDQYILSGKPVFIAVDPSCQYFKQQTGASMYGQPDASSDLPGLFKAYGIQYTPSMVVADETNASKVQSPDGGVATYPTWLSLTRKNLDPNFIGTSQLSSLLFVEPGALSLAPGAGLKMTSLVQSSAHSGLLATMALQFTQPDDLERQLKVDGKKTIAALFTGPLKTAFPNGEPASPPAPGKPAQSAASPSGLKVSKGSATLLVVADADWLMDDFSVRQINFLGSQMVEPLNDNLYFAENCLDYLGGPKDLLSIRGKGSSARPFTVVMDMQAAAERKYREKLDEVEAKLAGIQQHLKELLGKRGQTQTLIATPEMQKTIDAFQKQEGDARIQRRQIRLALREGINSLKYTLLFANLFASPLLVVAFGIWFYRHRRA